MFFENGCMRLACGGPKSDDEVGVVVRIKFRDVASLPRTRFVCLHVKPKVTSVVFS
jgi:hypothetical protein